MKTNIGPWSRFFWLWATLFLVVLPQNGFAKAKKKKPSKPVPVEVKIPGATDSGASDKGPKETEVQEIQEKYWARGEETEIGVIQNRLYSNKRKVEFGLLLGTVASDPFLVNTSLNLTAGYHFSELFSVHLGFMKNFVGPSAALTALESRTGVTSPTNMQSFWITADTRWNMLYGKVSLFSAHILYFDAYLSAGMGLVSTETGSYLALMPGIGQVFHINQTFSLNLHYKLFWYQEEIRSKAAATRGQSLGKNGNFGSSLMLGITVTLDPFSPKEAAPAAAPVSTQKPADGK